MNRWCKQALAAVVLAASLIPAADAAYSKVVAFGDSLSDNGRGAALSAGNFPPALYYPAGRFTNGPVAAEYLANALGATLSDYAVGGAMTGIGNYNYLTNSPAGLSLIPTLANTGMAQQISGWNSAGLDSAHTLFLLWGGPNDIFYGLATNPGNMPGVIQGAITNLASDIGVLYGLGARNFLVPNMPDLGKSPEVVAQGAGAQAIMTGISVAFNSGLQGGLASLAGLPGIQLYSADTFAMMNAAIANAPALGLTHTITGCLQDGVAAATFGTCPGYLFYDHVHPTTAGHAILGTAFAAAVAVPEPQAWMLMAGGLAVVVGWRRRRAST